MRLFLFFYGGVPIEKTLKKGDSALAVVFALPEHCYNFDCTHCNS